MTEVVHCFAPRRKGLPSINQYAVERVHPGLAHTLNSARSLICEQPPPRCSIASAPFLSLEPRRKPRERDYATRSVLQLASSCGSSVARMGACGGSALIYIRLLDRFRSLIIHGIRTGFENNRASFVCEFCQARISNSQEFFEIKLLPWIENYSPLSRRRVFQRDSRKACSENLSSMHFSRALRSREFPVAYFFFFLIFANLFLSFHEASIEQDRRTDPFQPM